ncbi:hypothetical protein XocBAI15_20865, partial [Xanthomonas oryzae pv. oryzicola]
METVQRLLPVL